MMNNEMIDIFKNHQKSYQNTNNQTNLYTNKISIRPPDTKYFYFCKSKEKKIIFLRISKCASSSILDYLTSNSNFYLVYDLEKEFLEENLEYHKQNYKFFTVIRDPKSRWISGLNEFMISVKKERELEVKKYIEKELKKNNFIFDGHTLPQIYFLNWECGTYNNLELLRLNQNLNQKISNLIGEDVQLKFENSSIDSEVKKNNLNFCKIMFETYCENNFKYYQRYESDYRLFNLSK